MWSKMFTNHKYALMPDPVQLHVHVYTNVIGSEEGGNFAQNAKYWAFASYHHSKAVRDSDFIPGLWAHQPLCFTNPTFEAIDSLLPEVVAIKPEVLYKTTHFQSQVVCMLTTPTQEIGRAWNS